MSKKYSYKYKSKKRNLKGGKPKNKKTHKKPYKKPYKNFHKKIAKSSMPDTIEDLRLPTRKESVRNTYADEIKKEFLNLDIDNNGYVDLKELQKGLKKYGINLSLSTTKKLIKSYDDNPDGQIELREFSQLKRDLDSRSLRQPMGIFK